MINPQRKAGRPGAFHRCADGTRIEGLSKLGDGRWRISGPPRFTFRAASEADALRRFAEWQRSQKKPLPMILPTATAPSGRPDNGPAVLAAMQLAKKRSMPGIHVTTSEDGKQLIFGSAVDEAAFWQRFVYEITYRREYAAKQSGIKALAWLETTKEPDPSPTMQELIDCYAAKPNVTPEEISRCKRFWTEFVGIVGIKTIRELTHEHVEAYERKLAGMDLAPKSVKHRYSRVRTVVAYALKRGKGQDDCRRALDKLAMLEAQDVNPLDPNPIESSDFWKIHAAAEAADDKTFATLLLFALNAALYSSEVGAVRWSDIDLERGEFSVRRRKTKVPRVAVLWPEVVAGLKKLPRERDTIFNTSRQAYNRCSIHRDWTKYRIAAKVTEVTFSMIRDASFTTACRVSLDQARVLAGHRLPGAVDHYVLRAPQFVADACQGIRNEFMAKRPKIKTAKAA